MILEDVYKYYFCNWSRACRELKMGRTTITNWQKRGYIPYRSQEIIELRTNGVLKASQMDCKH